MIKGQLTVRRRAALQVPRQETQHDECSWRPPGYSGRRLTIFWTSGVTSHPSENLGLSSRDQDQFSFVICGCPDQADPYDEETDLHFPVMIS